MFHHISGKLVEVNPTIAIVETGGIGYEIHISLNTFARLNGQQTVTLFLHPVFKEDAQTLFGFSETRERSLFRHLISVSGVGGNTARVILSSLSPDEATQAIASEDVASLKSVKGIGAKTAQRIVIDLKDKVSPEVSEGSEAKPTGALNKEAVSALEVLGYSPRSTEKIILKILREYPAASLEEIIKIALSKL